MKANNGNGNIPERDEWRTPQKLWNVLNKQYDFKFDCCASQNNSKCEYFASKRTEFQISTIIKDMAWMNPPFSKTENMFRHFFNIVKKGVAIYRCDNLETNLWQNIILPKADWIFIPNKRIAYEGMEGNGSRFPSALIGLNVATPKGLDGTTLIIPKEEKE